MSINANELRIGNWVIDGKTNTKVTVDGLQFTGRIVTADDTYDDYKRGIKPEPIPLTPEILEKCGGQWNHKCWHTVNKLNQCNFLICPLKQEGFWYLEYSSDFVAIQYIHQLQNLYFALTGEELEVKL